MLRSNTKKYCFKWFFLVHAAVPLIIAARITFGLDYIYAPLFIILSVAGQIAGDKSLKALKRSIASAEITTTIKDTTTGETDL